MFLVTVRRFTEDGDDGSHEVVVVGSGTFVVFPNDYELELVLITISDNTITYHLRAAMYDSKIVVHVRGCSRL